MKDFDAMFAEIRQERIPFTIHGERHFISRELPAALVLELARHEAEENVPPRLIECAARQIFGSDLIDALCARADFSFQQLEMMLQWAFSAINGEEDTHHGKFEARERKN